MKWRRPIRPIEILPIDFHAHWLPESIADLLRTRSAPPMIEKRADGGENLVSMFRPVPAEDALDTVEDRLALMDRHGIARGVLSLTPVMGVESLPIEDALPIARAVNDAGTDACAAHPDRFSALATLPVADMDAAAEEFDRVLRLPGMVGGLLPSDGFLSVRRAAKFRPLLDVAERHHAVVMVHYGSIADDPERPRPDLSDTKDLRIGTLDMQARLSSNMITFCMTDFLDDYPNVTVMSHNLGGNIPFEVERLDHRNLVDHSDRPLPSKAIRDARVMVDCNSLGASSIERAVEVYGAHRIVLGTDGTDFGMKWSLDAIAESKLAESDKDAILHGNAAAVLEPLISGAREAAE